MKKLILILSLGVFAFAAYYFSMNLEYSTDLNYIIYMSMWMVLILISIVGIVSYFPAIKTHKKHVRNLMYNSYSEHRIRNKEFDSQFRILN